MTTLGRAPCVGSKPVAAALLIASLAIMGRTAHAQGDAMAPLPPVEPVAPESSPTDEVTVSPEELVEQAITAREAGRDRDALPLLQQAFALSPTPRTTAQLGLCEQALGLWVDARVHLRQALEATGDRWVRQRRAPLSSALASVEEQLGTLEVLDGPAGATLRIGGRSLGTLPMDGPAIVVVGRATLEVIAEGYVPYSVEVTVRSGELTRQSVVLVPLPAVPRPSEVARITVVDSSVATQSPVAEREPLRKKWWLWTIVGAVVVGATVGSIVAATHDPGVQGPIEGSAGVATAITFGR